MVWCGVCSMLYYYYYYKNNNNYYKALLCGAPPKWTSLLQREAKVHHVCTWTILAMLCMCLCVFLCRTYIYGRVLVSVRFMRVDMLFCEWWSVGTVRSVCKYDYNLS